MWNMYDGTSFEDIIYLTFLCYKTFSVFILTVIALAKSKTDAVRKGIVNTLKFIFSL